LLSGAILVLLTLFIPVAYQSCGPSRTGLAFVRGASGELPMISLLTGSSGLWLYVVTLLLSALAILIALLPSAKLAHLRGGGLIRALFGAAGTISLLLLSNATYCALFYGSALFVPKAFPGLSRIVIPGIGILAAGLALGSGSVRKSKAALVLLIVVGVECLLLLSNFVVSLSMPSGYLPDAAERFMGTSLADLYWLVPVCLWVQFSLVKKAGPDPQWPGLRSGIFKAYLPSLLGIPAFLRLAVAAGHVWGFIPYTFGNHLMSLGYMRLAKRNGQQRVEGV
jgi:hypothetical protein